MKPARRSKLYRLPLWTGILFCFSMILILLFYSSTHRSLSEICYERLTEATTTTVKDIDGLFADNRTYLRGLASLLSQEEEIFSENTFELLSQFASMMKSSRLRILLPNNVTYDINGRPLNLSGTIYFDEQAKAGEHFSPRVSSLQFSDQKIIRQYQPVYHNGQVAAVLYATYVCNDIPNMMTNKCYGGLGRIFLIDKRNGNIIADSYSQNYDSITDYIGTDIPYADTLRKQIFSGKNGYTHFKDLDTKRDTYLSFAPSESFFEWEILITADYSIAMKDMLTFRKIAFISLFLEFLSFALYFIWIFRRYRRMNFLYSHDALTEISNRYGLQETFKMAENADNIGVLIFDIDFFKKINDTYGHPNGDIILKELVDISQKVIPENAYIHRWGGEEFAIVYMDGSTSYPNAQQLLEAVREHTFILNYEQIHITISIGLITTKAGNAAKDFDKLMIKADNCLYEAKNKGRNQIVYEAL